MRIGAAQGAPKVVVRAQQISMNRVGVGCVTGITSATSNHAFEHAAWWFGPCDSIAVGTVFAR